MQRSQVGKLGLEHLKKLPHGSPAMAAARPLGEAGNSTEPFFAAFSVGRGLIFAGHRRLGGLWALKIESRHDAIMMPSCLSF